MAERGGIGASGGDGDKRNVRLALAATRPARSTRDVTTDELLGLRDGTLSADDRERVLAALDGSEASYEEWLALNRYLDDDEPAETVRRGARYVPWTIGAAAAAALAAIVLMFSRPPSLDELLDRSYAEALASGAVSITTSPLAFIGDPGSGTGFSGGDPSPAQRALGSGFWAGGVLLSGETEGSYPAALLPPGTAAADVGVHPWDETDWAAHATFGRWVVLAAVACGQPPQVPTEFWTPQAAIADQLRAALPADGAGAETRALRSQLDELAGPLQQLTAGDNPGRACNGVVRSARQTAALVDRRVLFNTPER